MEREVPNAQNQSEDEENNDEVEPPLARETRNRRPPERYGNPYTFNTTQEETLIEPKTYKEAVSSPQATHWKQAMQSEFKGLENNDTWTLVDKPKDKNVLPWKWIYKVKYGADGQVDKYTRRATRLWNILANDLQLTLSLPLSTFKSRLMEYYKNALVQSYDPEDARSWKTICTSCNVARNMSRRLTCCF